MQSKNRRRKTIRLQGYDYSQTGAFFVTICTYNHRCLLGQIIDGEMILNRAGRIVQEEWLNLPRLRPQVRLDQFVVMPNHFHGILMLIEETEGTASRAPTREGFGKPISGSLPTIIRGFKSVVTHRINLTQHTPGQAVWQRGFYEHVIRNEESLNRIREYILTNPSRWELDRENPRRRGEDEFDHWLAQFKTRPGQCL